MVPNKSTINNAALLDYVNRYESALKFGSTEMRLSMKDAAGVANAIMQLSLKLSEANQQIIEAQAQIIKAQARALKAEEEKIIKVTVAGADF